MEQLKIKIKYFDKDMPKLRKLPQGDWIDLRVRDLMVVPNMKRSINNAWNRFRPEEFTSEGVYYHTGDIIVMKLGIAMALPEGYEADVRPRSSTFKNYGLILTNSAGVVDNSYRGNGDEWGAIYYATRDGRIEKYDRVAQFRINRNMTPILFYEVDTLGNNNRSGFGSTGTK